MFKPDFDIKIKFIFDISGQSNILAHEVIQDIVSISVKAEFRDISEF